VVWAGDLDAYLQNVQPENTLSNFVNGQLLT
jgi:hypothetical protein